MARITHCPIVVTNEVSARRIMFLSASLDDLYGKIDYTAFESWADIWPWLSKAVEGIHSLRRRRAIKTMYVEIVRRYITGLDQEQGLPIQHLQFQGRCDTEIVRLEFLGWMRINTRYVLETQVRTLPVPVTVGSEYLYAIEPDSWWDPYPMDAVPIAVVDENPSQAGSLDDYRLSGRIEDGNTTWPVLSKYLTISNLELYGRWTELAEEVPWLTALWELAARSLMASRYTDEWLETYAHNAEYPIAIETRTPEYLIKCALVFLVDLVGVRTVVQMLQGGTDEHIHETTQRVFHTVFHTYALIGYRPVTMLLYTASIEECRILMPGLYGWMHQTVCRKMGLETPPFHFKETPMDDIGEPKVVKELLWGLNNYEMEYMTFNFKVK